MTNRKIEILERALLRERQAKEVAEKILEERLYKLYSENVELNKKFKSQAEFQDLLIENLVDALFVVDFKCNIIKSNKEARKLIGLDLDEDFPKSIKNFAPKNYKSLLHKFKNVNLKIQNDETFKWQFTNRKNQNKTVMIKCKLLYNYNNEAHAIQAIVRDITTEHELDLVLQRQYKNQKFESLILRDLIAENDLYENAWSLVNNIAKYLNTDDCVFYSVIDDKLIQIAATGNKIKPNTKDIIQRLEIPVKNGIVGEVARSKQGVFINNTGLKSNYIVDGVKRLSEITVPIILDDRVIGIIDSEHPEENYYNQDQLDFLSQLSVSIALRIKTSNIELEKNLNSQELIRTKNRLELIFNSDHNAEVIESTDGKILDLGNAFLKLFNLPLDYKSSLVGMPCTEARNNLKVLFKDGEKFVHRIDELISNSKPVLQEILELKDGRYLSRDFMPVMLNNKLDCFVWRYRDVTLSVNYEKSIEFEKIKYKGIIDNMNLGLLEVDHDDNILSVNKSLCEMSGYSETDLYQGKAKNILLAQDSLQNRIFKNKREFEKNNYSKPFELEIVRKDGTIRNWLSSGSPIKDINGISYGSVWVNLDITELKELVVKNEKLIKSLLDSNEELSHYAHLVSHDLKTPLRTISTFLDWIYEDNKENIKSESLEYINTIEDTIRDMDKLISSTLQFAEIRNSDGDKKVQIDLFQVIQKLITNSFSHFENDFKIKLPEAFPTIYFNEVQIKQIFQNLIDNSFKYRDKNKNSYVSISYEDSRDHYVFKVKDNGIGIAKNHHDKVFRIFKKFNQRTDSSGVGLWIIKKIIENAGGKIWFDSTFGEGTTFYFTIKK